MGFSVQDNGVGADVSDRMMQHFSKQDNGGTRGDSLVRARTQDIVDALAAEYPDRNISVQCGSELGDAGGTMFVSIRVGPKPLPRRADDVAPGSEATAQSAPPVLPDAGAPAASVGAMPASGASE